MTCAEQTDGMARSGLQALPTGTVTFVMTDIEGSTASWESRPADMPGAIRLHDEILHGVIAVSGGQRPVEQGEGDSVVAVFTNAQDAVAAAVDAQRSLQRDLPWLPVRMAVHTGDAELRNEGNYAGATIIRCARLRACAHGGQILISDATAAVIADHLPPGAGLVESGVVRLRGFARPERVFQLTHAELRSQFPALRSLEATPTNVPVAASSLVGRDAETGHVLALLRAGRLVTLTGSGGCGKTRLAQHVAPLLVDEFPGGVWWVELASVNDAAAVVERVRTTFAFAQFPSKDPVAELTNQLRAQGPVLLVLDNAEHLLDAAAGLVEAVLRRCSEVAVLVTSREPLGAAGEQVFRVPSLTVPARGEGPIDVSTIEQFDATRLFLERARQVRPNFTVDDRAAEHVAAICARLDGIPLAIELAAARVRAMPLTRLAAGLDDAFRLLTGGTRTAVARQQTLLASIAWSFDLLDDRERAVLNRLAVFQAPFLLDAAETVAADGELVEDVEVLDLLQRLVDKSLLQFDDGSDRYRILETVRQFSLDRLRGSDELTAARDRHAAWFAGWSEEVGQGRYGLTFTARHPDVPDLMAALDWAMAADPLLAYRILRGLGWVRNLLGHYGHLHQEKAWLTARVPELPATTAGVEDQRERAGWATAVAGLAGSAATMLWADYPGLAQQAKALLVDPDAATTRLLDIPEAIFRALSEADLSLIDHHLAEAQAAGDVVAHGGYAVLATFVRSQLGHLAACHRIVDQVRIDLERAGEPFDASCGSYAYLLCVLVEEGRLREATDLAMIPTGMDSTFAGTTGVVRFFVAHATGDTVVAERGAAMLGVEQPDVVERTLQGARAFLADRAGRHDEALQLVRSAVDGFEFRPVLGSYLYRWLVMWLLRAGDLQGAASYARRFGVDADTIADAPLSHARHAQLRALVARAEGRHEDLRRDAHDLIGHAAPAGLVLSVIDGLELLGEDSAAQGDTERAAHLLGAAAAERQRRGYEARMVPDETELLELSERLRTSEAQGWAAGASLDLADAVELVRRSRGPRTRPSHGWASLTPTEAKVVDLVADGLSNDEIASRLVVSTATVKTHLSHVYAKTGSKHRTELAARWRQR
jgi:predicted ATPase/class 3 adenylate cyclase/DNA-binding CsgD family transcriptional regulator